MAHTNFAPKRVAAVVTAAVLLTVAAGPLLAQKSTAVPAKADARLVAHVLNRMGFGPRPGDVARVEAMGLSAYIDSQLHPERVADTALTERLGAFTTLALTSDERRERIYIPAAELRRDRQRQQAQQARTQPPAGGVGTDMTMTEPPRPELSPEQRQVQQMQTQVVNELMQAKVLRAVMSERQLEEVLVDFWFNHFNVFIGKGQVRDYLPDYEQDAIRPYVFGSFRDMLGATAHNPAMLFYLDNFQSQAPEGAMVLADPAQNRLRRGGQPFVTRPGQQPLRPGQIRTGQPGQARPGATQGLPPQPQRPPRGLNENYARELMELHTLGVDGGYTQQDVVALARILTGWTIDRPQAGGEFVFRPGAHDAGDKTFLGHKFPAGKGMEEGERALDILAAHPSTARYVAFKLAQRFVADEPPAALVARVAKVFEETKGDLREVTRAVLTSPEFFAEDYYRAKVKTPFEFVVSAARAAGATVTNAQPMVQALRELGMPLYGCQPPTGYSMTADAWVNTGALLNRMNFALQLVSGGVPLRQPGDQPATANPNRPNAPARPNQQARLQAFGAQLRANQQARRPIQVDVAALAPDTTDASRERLITTMLSGEASDATRETLGRATTAPQLVALTLGAPEFQRR
jgi:uncharacterized protein (DUF1800 family)